MDPILQNSKLHDHQSSEYKHYCLSKVKLVILVMLLVNSSLGIIGNIALMYKFSSQSSLRTEINAAIMSLAVIDFLWGFFLFLTMIYTYLEAWPFGYLMCRISILMAAAVPLIHLWTLIAASINNFIRLPMNSSLIAKKVNERIILIFVIVWILAFLQWEFSSNTDAVEIVIQNV